MSSRFSASRRLIPLLSLFVALFGLFFSVSAAADVRILLDISRSMAENDPARTRIEAIETLIDRLPEGERAGIWTFGQYVNLLVPHAEVNDQWRNDAKRRISQQTSLAVRTNMGRALEDAAYDFGYSTFAGDVDAVLITDGNVDIAPNAEVNQIERARILNQVVNRFSAANARIHTIALSDQADSAFLKQLSEQTGGQFQQIQRGGNIALAMLGLYSDVVPATALPVLENAFEVDPSVSELVVVLKHNEGTASLKSPSGQTTSAATPRNQRWREGDGYTQVTINAPAAGRWMIEGIAGEQSQVSAYSDINVQWLEPATTSVTKGKSISMVAQLVDSDEQPIGNDLVSMIAATLEIDGRPIETTVQEGRISAVYQPAEQVQSAEVELVVEGGTFSRIANRQLRFVNPYVSEVLMTSQGYEWRLYPNRLLGDVDAIDAQAMVRMTNDEADQAVPEGFELQEGGYWMWLLAYDNPDGAYEVSLAGTVQQASNAMPLNAETITLTLPAAMTPSMAMTPDLMPAKAAEMEPMSADFVKDPMPEFAELQPDLIVFQEEAPEQGDWVEEPVAEKGGMGWLSYLLLSIPGVLILAIAYFVYRRFEKKSDSGELENEIIMGGDEFSVLDDPLVLSKDDDLDLNALDEDDDDESIPVMDDRIGEPEESPPAGFALDADDMLDIDPELDDIAADAEQTDQPEAAEEEPPQEEAFELDEAVEIETETEQPEPDEPAPEEPDSFGEVDEEELFDISSIDDDLTDLDLALEGDDPFALDDDEKPQ